MSIPLVVATWRLGSICMDNIEPLFLKDDEKENILSNLQEKYKGVYYLNTCQRLVLVSSGNSQSDAKMLRDDFLRFKGIEPTNTSYNGEIFYGYPALEHLAYLISSLDSIVIGEDQILHQFKQAYAENKSYLDSNLNFVIQQMIKLGKRIRRETPLKFGKASTYAIIEQFYEDKLTKASSIAVIGTGKMAMHIVKNLAQLNPNIHIYSRKASRIGADLEGYTVQSFDHFQHHPLVITATTVDMPLITNDLISPFGHKEMLIFDLGMPRNCDVVISKMDNVELIALEELLNLSQEKSSNAYNNECEIHSFLEYEMEQIMHKLAWRQKSHKVISLRKDLLDLAEGKIAEFAQNGNDEKKLQQFINQLIHISQKHLERAMMEE